MITRARLLAILLGAAAAPCAWSFFDDFLGDKLQDGWGWGSELRDRPIYDVSDGKLNVYGITNDFFGQRGGVFEHLTEEYGRYDDHQMSARVTWETCEYQLFGLGSAENGRIWYFVNLSENIRKIGAQVGNDYTFIDAPPNGTHEFTLKRVNRRVSALFDGVQFFALPSDFVGEKRAVDLEFWSDDRYSFAPIRVDYVSVVPEPGTFVQLVVLAGAAHALVRFLRKTAATSILKR